MIVLFGTLLMGVIFLPKCQMLGNNVEDFTTIRQRPTIHKMGTEDETLSTIYVAERMTWQDGYDYCKSKRKRLKYISPSTKAVFRDQNPHIASDVTFWTAHKVTNETVTHGKRYYSEFPLDNIKDVSSPLLCVYLVYEADNKRVGWEAGECHDNSVRYPFFCDIAFPTDKKSMTLYEANLTWPNANTFCEKIDGSLLQEMSGNTGLELGDFFHSGNWSNTSVSSFWTNHTLLDHVTTVEQWPIDKTSNTTNLEEIYCAYLILEGQVDKNIEGWMSDFCLNSSRSFLCEKESDEFYFKPYKNYKPVGLNVLFEARQLSVTDCIVKCNATTEVGIPCELFVWNSLNFTCYFMNYGEIVLNISYGYYHEQRITNYKFVEGLTTYKRFSNTPILGDYYQTGDTTTTINNNADINDQNFSGRNKKVLSRNTEGNIYILVSALVVTAASFISFLTFCKYITITKKLEKRRKRKLNTISRLVDETIRGNIDFIPEFDDEEFSRMKFRNNPPTCYLNMIE